jgi:hypothetical protein
MFRRHFWSYLNWDPYQILQATPGLWYRYQRSSATSRLYWMTFIGHLTILPNIPQVLPGQICFGVFFGHVWIGTPIIFPRLPEVTGTNISVPQPPHRHIGWLLSADIEPYCPISQVLPVHIWFGVFFGHIWIGTPIIFPRLPEVTGTNISVPQPPHRHIGWLSSDIEPYCPISHKFYLCIYDSASFSVISE